MSGSVEEDVGTERERRSLTERRIFFVLLLSRKKCLVAVRMRAQRVLVESNIKYFRYG